MISIKPAQVCDAKRLAELAEATFRDAFTAQNTAEDMNAYCQQSFGEAIQAQELTNPNYYTLLAEQEGRLLGYTQLRWGDTPRCVNTKSAGEVQRIYVSKAFHGNGLAQQLMATSLKVFEQHNNDAVWLGVWEENPRAIAFYKKFGFTEVGSHIFTVGSDPQRDVILMRPVIASV